MSVRIKQIVAAAVLLAACLSPSVHAAEYWTVDSWWHLPEGVSTYANPIDALFNFILILTGVVFIATEGLLLLFIIKYRHREGTKAHYSHGNHKAEMIWTITPAITLIVIALIQARTWNQIKAEIPTQSDMPDHNKSLQVQVFAKQFTWYFRYPDAEGHFRDPKKSVCTEKKLVVPKDTPIVLEMTSDDVIHSFFLPYMRLKQDLVPGMQIRAWFDATKTTKQMREEGRPRMTLIDPNKQPKTVEWDYPLACAELCGIQHYQMAGRVVVLERAEYDEWLKIQRAAFEAGIYPDGSDAAMSKFMSVDIASDGTDTSTPAELFDKSWQIVVDKEGHEHRKYGGENKRTALKVYKTSAHKPEKKEEKVDEKPPAAPKTEAEKK